MRRKFVLMAMKYSGLKLLLLRRSLPELRENHQLPLQSELYGFAKYRDEEKAFMFPNGSRLKLGYCDSESDVFQFQGTEYDIIGLEEATHFTETQKDFLTTCNRTTRTDIKPRMYYTANPGGVGHQWFKRLFIDKDYRSKEKAEDYVFVQATVYDNDVLMQNNPEYVETLENLPEDMKRAHLYGDWDVFYGQYFTEWRKEIHVIKESYPELPPWWKRFRSLDYGLDMTACYWWAVDSQGREYVYRELYQPNLTLTQAAKKIEEMTPRDKEGQPLEKYSYTVASPDLWNRRQDTGMSGEEIMYAAGLKNLIKADHRRIPGWRTLKEHLTPFEDEGGATIANLRVFDCCHNLIRTLPQAQHDEHNGEDVADKPHDISHSAESIRYGVMSRPGATAIPATRVEFKKLPQDLLDDYYGAPKEERQGLLQRWGLT